MTADFNPFDMKFLGHVATRIVNEMKGVNRVVYDVTSKPPLGDDGMIYFWCGESDTARQRFDRGWTMLQYMS